MTVDLRPLRREIRAQKATPARLKELAANVTLARLIARQYGTPISVLEALARNADVFTRRNVARNSRTPTSILLQLAKERRFNILKAVARNWNTPREVINELARHRHPTVRAACLGHPQLSFNHYFQLAHDPHPSVRACWLELELENVRLSRSPTPSPEEISEWLITPDVEVRRVLVGNLNLLPPDQKTIAADVLVNDNDLKIRECAAPHASTAALDSRQHDESAWVRTFTAARTADEAILENLLVDPDETVLRSAAHNLKRMNSKEPTHDHP